MATLFADRAEAGRALAALLTNLRGRADVVVLGLPRGGVPVAYEVARALGAPLDVIVVGKLGVPYRPELAMGAIGEGGTRVLDADIIEQSGVSQAELAAVERRERTGLLARVARLGRGRERLDLTGRVAVVVDDGMATGSTARVACQVARRAGAASVVLAVPVAPRVTVQHIPEADRVVCAAAPERFLAVGAHYRDLAPTTDEEVLRLLDDAARRQAAVGLPVAEVEIPADGVRLGAHLHLPAPAAPVVLFAHGSGSSRRSARNRLVADDLNGAGLGTLLLDLLTPDEEGDRDNVFDVRLLARRLLAAARWLRDRPETAESRLGLFGASTGAAAALWAAAEPGADIAAVVSRGGRPDLAGSRLASVEAPTLLIVGGDDALVLRLNRAAAAQLRCVHELVVVPRATHLFEEPGALEQVADLAREWFARHLARTGRGLGPSDGGARSGG